MSYTPTEATTIISNVILTVTNEQPIISKVSAIGKYPFVQLNTSKLDFERLLIGKSAVKEILIKNQSPVIASFSIFKIVEDECKDNAFSLDMYEIFNLARFYHSLFTDIKGKSLQKAVFL